jgi:hypothetical protein
VFVAGVNFAQFVNKSLQEYMANFISLFDKIFKDFLNLKFSEFKNGHTFKISSFKSQDIAF